MVRALFTAPPRRTDADEQTIEFLGISADQLKREPEQIDVWPEHHIPLRLIHACMTQWRAAPNGLIGLDYNVIPWLSQLIGIGSMELREAWPAFQVMESEALACMAQQRGRADG